MIVTIDHPTHVVMEQNFINILSACTLHLQLNKYVITLVLSLNVFVLVVVI